MHAATMVTMFTVCPKASMCSHGAYLLCCNLCMTGNPSDTAGRQAVGAASIGMAAAQVPEYLVSEGTCRQPCASSSVLVLGTSCFKQHATMCRQPCAGPGRLGRAAGSAPAGSRQEAAAAQAAEALCQGRDVRCGCCPAGRRRHRCLPRLCGPQLGIVALDVCGCPRTRICWGVWLADTVHGTATGMCLAQQQLHAPCLQVAAGVLSLAAACCKLFAPCWQWPAQSM